MLVDWSHSLDSQPQGATEDWVQKQWDLFMAALKETFLEAISSIKSDASTRKDLQNLLKAPGKSHKGCPGVFNGLTMVLVLVNINMKGSLCDAFDVVWLDFMRAVDFVKRGLSPRTLEKKTSPQCHTLCQPPGVWPTCSGRYLGCKTTPK